MKGFIRSSSLYVKSSTYSSKNSPLLKRNLSNVSIADIYAGKAVFITGGTGFLGKVFVEKLLYSCQDLDKVYVLVRPKKGSSINKRIQDLVDDPLFDRIKQAKPQALSKLVPIAGDISEPKLGINAKDEEILRERVSVIIHSAATVKFNEPLSTVMNLNFEGTRRVMSLCQKIKNIHSFVYVSTAYSQLYQKVLEEEAYPPPRDYKEVYKFIKKYGDNQKETEQFISVYPNTYSFSKSLTENYVASNTNGVPTTIVRPSIVGATYKEPVPGWLNSWMTLGALFDVAVGHNQYVLSNEDVVFDLIPVDYVSNLTLVAAAKGNQSDSVNVYNSASSGCNPVTWLDCYRAFIKHSIENNHYVNYPRLIPVSSSTEMRIKTLLNQKIPAFLSDLLSPIRGEKSSKLKQVNRIITSRDAYSYFCNNSWTFKSDKARALVRSLSKEDQKTFACDPSDIDWPTYQKLCYLGIIKYLWKK